MFVKILNQRELNDLELLMNNSLAPINYYINQKEYIYIITTNRLPNNILFPFPFILSIPANLKSTLTDTIILKDETNFPIAYVHVNDIYEPSIEQECLGTCGSSDDNHPYVKIIKERANHMYIGGQIEKINDIRHYDFLEYRLNPDQVKQLIKDDYVIGFQTRNPLHRSHVELIKKTIQKAEKKLGHPVKVLIHPVFGITQICDIEYHTRVRCYIKLLKYFPENRL